MGSAIPVSAVMDSDFAGRGGGSAMQTVYRIVCPDISSQGTGFLHNSGNIITADHVVRGSQAPVLVLPNGTGLTLSAIAADADYDLALLKPGGTLLGSPLTIAPTTKFSFGAQVSTWGFPGGYIGAHPMLSVGYLSAVQQIKTASGKQLSQWVINAAFNSGNSGGPLIHLESGTVMGVVSSKLAPISPFAQSILTALENQKSGLIYSATNADGSTVQMSEGQLVGVVLKELRRQVQLVIGMATPLDDLQTFLKANGITP